MSLGRRIFIMGLAGAGMAAMTGGSASAGEIIVKGAIRRAYDKLGGDAVMGLPIANESKLVINGYNTYAQVFELGQIWYGSGVTAVDRIDERVRLSAKGKNFRPVFGLRDIWRSDDLDGLSSLDQRIIHDLGINTQIGVNSGSDPRILGVRNYKFYITNSVYRAYVTDPANRAAIGWVCETVAKRGPVVIHSLKGRDRAGWIADVLQSLAGIDIEDRDRDYLLTKEYAGYENHLFLLNLARDTMMSIHGSVENYLTIGCGLSVAKLNALSERLA